VVESIPAVVRMPRAAASRIAGAALVASCLALPAIGARLPSGELRAKPVAIPAAREILAERVPASSPAFRERDWERELAASNAAPPRQRIRALLDAAENGYDLESDAGRPRAAEIRRIAATLPGNDPLRGRAFLLRIAMDGLPVDEERRGLRKLLEALRDAPPEAAALRGRLALALAPLLPQSAERLRTLFIARDSLRGGTPGRNVELAEAWSMLASELAIRDARAAEAEWKALVAWHRAAPSTDGVSRMIAEAAESGYMRFLMRRGRFDAAESLARPSVDRAMAEAVRGDETGLRRVLAKVQGLFWIAIARRDATHAGRWLDAWADAASASADLDPQLALARLTLADLAGDAQGVSKARAWLSTLVATTVLCESGAIARADHPGAARARKLVERYGICRG